MLILALQHYSSAIYIEIKYGGKYDNNGNYRNFDVAARKDPGIPQLAEILLCSTSVEQGRAWPPAQRLSITKGGATHYRTRFHHFTFSLFFSRFLHCLRKEYQCI